MASIASVSEGISPEELAKLTPEEREAYVKSIVDKMTERYEEYKAAYENFVDQMANSDDIDVLRDFYGLIYGDTGTYVDSSNYVNCGMWYYDFFQKLCVPDYALPDNMSPLDIIRRYQDTGDLEGSGMVDLLALGLENQGFYDDWRDKREQVDEYLAIAVDSFNTYRDEPISVDDYLRSVTKGAADLEVWSSGFYENYKSALKVGIATQGLKELQGHARYDSYYLLEAFQNYDDSKWSDEAFMQSLCDSTDIDIDRLAYMSQSEVKTFRYLYDTEGEAAAQEFLNSISPTLNRREGYIKASIYYNQVMSGSNEGLEAAWDHFCVGGKGYGDGLSYFLDGFVDCVAPSREMSANEYAQVALLGYLTEGGTDYDTSLLAAYNIGKTMGEETIPTILDLIRPGLGKASKMISNYGNSVETYIRADESTTYGEALPMQLLI